jgi:prepilin-type N-terminal cleavage/methylation domain-containing protein
MTLVELLVVLALLGVVAVLVAPAIPQSRTSPEAVFDALRAEARREAVRDGRSITKRLSRGERTLLITAHPDGRVLVDSVPRSLPALPGPASP